jgi:transposase InsO family protein
MTLLEERKSAIHLLRAGQSVRAVADELGRTPRWVRKWRKRYQLAGWEGLIEGSRRPHRLARQTTAANQQAIRKARSELEAEAAAGHGLKYIGGQAIRTRLKEQGIRPLPSIATIERVIRAAGMTRPYQRVQPLEIRYPHVRVRQPQTLIQVDIVPHYLKGGARVACFNAIDVASRFPTGQAYAHRRSQEAAAFLIHVWQELGVAKYTQVDNEGCFSGGFTHPYVLGKVVRLALQAGTELIFSPVRDPQSNGFVERFHQDYDKHVWEDTYLGSIPEVQKQADHFFALYRHRPHRRLNEQTPNAVHEAPVPIPDGLQSTAKKRPLYEGQVHFMRKVLADQTISVLNVSWSVPTTKPHRGVWATLDIKMSGAKLIIFDAAPDVPIRKRFACYPFKLTEPVLAHPVLSPRRSPSVFLSAVQLVARVSTHFLSGTMS